MAQLYGEAGCKAFEDALEHMREIYKMSVQLARQEAAKDNAKNDCPKVQELEEKLKRVTRERNEAAEARNVAVMKQKMAMEEAARQEKNAEVLKQKLIESQARIVKLEQQLNKQKDEAETIKKLRELLGSN